MTDFRTLVGSNLRISVRDSSSQSFPLRTDRIGVGTTTSSYRIPQNRTYTYAQYGLDSEGNAPGTVLGFSLGGLYGQKYSKSGFPTTADGNGTVTFPLSAPTFFTSISYSSLGDNYIYIFIGYFNPPTTGTYTFYTSSDDGSAVWIGDDALNNNATASDAVTNNNFGGSQGNTKRSGSIALTAGTFYPIRIMGTEGGGGDNLTFSWSGPSISETTDLTQYYYYSGDGSNFASASSANTVGLSDFGQFNFTINSLITASATKYFNMNTNEKLVSQKVPKNTAVNVDLVEGSGGSGGSGESSSTAERWTIL